MIYDSIYYENIQVLDAHTAQIKHIFISYDDSTLVTSCQNGFVYVWNLFSDQFYAQKYDHKSDPYHCIDYDKENDIFAGCTVTHKVVNIYSGILTV